MNPSNQFNDLSSKFFKNKLVDANQVINAAKAKIAEDGKAPLTTAKDLLQDLNQKLAEITVKKQVLEADDIAGKLVNPFNQALRTVQLQFGKVGEDDFIAQFKADGDKKALATQLLTQISTYTAKQKAEEPNANIVEDIRNLFSDELALHSIADNADLLVAYAQKKIDQKQTVIDALNNSLLNITGELPSVGSRAIVDIKDIAYAAEYNNVKDARNTNFFAILNDVGDNKEIFVSVPDNGTRAYLSYQNYEHKLTELGTQIQQEIDNPVKNAANLVKLQSEYEKIRKNLGNVAKGNEWDTLQKYNTLRAIKTHKDIDLTGNTQGLFDPVPMNFALDNNGGNRIFFADKFGDNVQELAKLDRFNISTQTRAYDAKYTEITNAIEQEKVQLVQRAKAEIPRIANNLQQEFEAIFHGHEKQNAYSAQFKQYTDALGRWNGNTALDDAAVDGINNRRSDVIILNNEAKRIADFEKNGLKQNIASRQAAITDRNEADALLYGSSGIGYEDLAKLRADIILEAGTLRGNLFTNADMQLLLGTRKGNPSQTFEAAKKNPATPLRDLEEWNKAIGAKFDELLEDPNAKYHTVSHDEEDMPQYTEHNIADLKGKFKPLKDALGLLNGKKYDTYEDFFSDAMISVAGQKGTAATTIILDRGSNIMNPAFATLKEVQQEYNLLNDAKDEITQEYGVLRAELKGGNIGTDFIDELSQTDNKYDRKKTLFTQHISRFTGDLKNDNDNIVKVADGTTNFGVHDANHPTKMDDDLIDEQTAHTQELDNIHYTVYGTDGTDDVQELYVQQLTFENLIKDSHNRYDASTDVIGKNNIYKALSEKVVEDMEAAKKDGKLGEFIAAYRDVLEYDIQHTQKLLDELDEQSDTEIAKENNAAKKAEIRTYYDDVLKPWHERRLAEDEALLNAINVLHDPEQHANVQDDEATLQTRIATQFLGAGSDKIDDLAGKISVSNKSDGNFMVFHLGGQVDENGNPMSCIVPRTQEAQLAIQPYDDRGIFYTSDDQVAEILHLMNDEIIPDINTADIIGYNDINENVDLIIDDTMEQMEQEIAQLKAQHPDAEEQLEELLAHYQTQMATAHANAKYRSHDLFDKSRIPQFGLEDGVITQTAIDRIVAEETERLTEELQQNINHIINERREPELSPQEALNQIMYDMRRNEDYTMQLLETHYARYNRGRLEAVQRQLHSKMIADDIFDDVDEVEQLQIVRSILAGIKVEGIDADQYKSFVDDYKRAIATNKDNNYVGTRNALVDHLLKNPVIKNNKGEEMLNFTDVHPQDLLGRAMALLEMDRNEIWKIKDPEVKSLIRKYQAQMAVEREAIKDMRSLGVHKIDEVLQDGHKHGRYTGSTYPAPSVNKDSSLGQNLFSYLFQEAAMQAGITPDAIKEGVINTALKNYANPDYANPDYANLEHKEIALRTKDLIGLEKTLDNEFVEHLFDDVPVSTLDHKQLLDAWEGNLRQPNISEDNSSQQSSHRASRPQSQQSNASQFI